MGKFMVGKNISSPRWTSGFNRLMAGIISIVVAVSLFFIANTVMIIKKLKTVEHAPTPYAMVQAAKYVGQKFLAKFMANPPEGVKADSWHVGHDTSISTLPASYYQQPAPPSMLSYTTARGTNITVKTMIFGAGQAKTFYDKLVNNLTDNTNLFDPTNTPKGHITVNNVSLMTRGDVIVSVISDDANLLKTVTTDYLVKLDEMLQQSGCVDLNENSDDASRSFYYDKRAYSGLQKSQKVAVNTKIITPSVPQALLDSHMRISRMFVDPAERVTVSKPETPLPANFPSDMPKKPNIPTFTVQPSTPSNSQTVLVQAADYQGPGCGWTWTGQVKPYYNVQALKQNENMTINNAKNQLSNNIMAYNKSIIDYSLKTMIDSSFIADWESYTDNVSQTVQKWKDLTAKRDSFKTTWLEYVDKAQKFKTITSNMFNNGELNDISGVNKEILKSWQKNIVDCVATKLSIKPSDAAKLDYNTVKDSNPLTVVACEKTIPKPNLPPTASSKELTDSLLKEYKPVKPTLPDGMTIPESWPQDPLK